MDLRAAVAACLTCIEKSNVLLAQCQAAPISECDLAELSKLIEIEIDLGFSFLTTAKIARSGDHKQEVLQGAITSCKTAERFARRVPAHLANQLWSSRLVDLQFSIANFS
jgi:hypothetical protein